MSDSQEKARTCEDCELVIYDVSYSDDRGNGYLNPDYCPKCGGEL
jgi:hypothetical protein